MNERQGRGEAYGESARRSISVCVCVCERARARERRDEDKRERERRKIARGKRDQRRGARHGRLNDDSEVDGFLGPFYIETQRSA